MIGRARRWLRATPVEHRLMVSLGMAFLVALGVAALPTAPGNRSEVGYWLKGWRRPRVAVSPRMAFVREHPDGRWEAARLSELDERGWPLEPTPDDGILLAVFRPEVAYDGFFWPTRRHDRTRIEARTTWGRGQLVVLPPAGRRAFMEAAMPGVRGARWDALAAADFNQTTTWLAGYVVNGLMLVGVVVAPVVFPWAAARRALNDLPRRFVARENWQCQACGYDLRGLAGGRCPECGATAGAGEVAERSGKR